LLPDINVEFAAEKEGENKQNEIENSKTRINTTG